MTEKVSPRETPRPDLRDYVQHKGNCDSLSMCECGHSRSRHYTWAGVERHSCSDCQCRTPIKPAACTCGLDALLASSPVVSQQEIRDRIRELAKFVTEKHSESASMMALMEARALGRAEASSPVVTPDQTVDDVGTHAAECASMLLDTPMRPCDCRTSPVVTPSDLEMELRQIWWTSHGCVTALYGDDGEMQCSKHGLDFKRMPLDELRERVRQIKWEVIGAKLSASPVVVETPSEQKEQE